MPISYTTVVRTFGRYKSYAIKVGNKQVYLFSFFDRFRSRFSGDFISVVGWSNGCRSYSFRIILIYRSIPPPPPTKMFSIRRTRTKSIKSSLPQWVNASMPSNHLTYTKRRRTFTFCGHEVYWIKWNLYAQFVHNKQYKHHSSLHWLWLFSFSVPIFLLFPLIWTSAHTTTNNIQYNSISHFFGSVLWLDTLMIAVPLYQH